MIETIFIIAPTRLYGANWAKAQPAIGPYRVIINEEEACQCLRGNTPAVVIVLNGDYDWAYDPILLRLRARTIHL